jgi:hypothetical protein
MRPVGPAFFRHFFPFPLWTSKWLKCVS